MTDQVRRFDLSEQTLEVIVEDGTTGQRFELVHVFRQPTDGEWLEYIRASAPVRVVDGKVRENDAVPELALWDACIDRVDDRYLWQGQPLMAQPDWKAKMRASHKYVAARALLAVRHRVVDGPLA